MITLRCTQKVLRRLGISGSLPEPGAPTNALGDWYVNLLHFGRKQLVMATSERSLLTVLLPARELRESLVPNLCDVTYMLLLEIGVDKERAAREAEAMQPAAFGRTASRRVLGSMNDFAVAVGWHIQDRLRPMEIMLRLAGTPMSAIREGGRDYGRPAAAARELLGAPDSRQAGSILH
jgi:hypothetical protein